jgi:hypothetical protein
MALTDGLQTTKELVAEVQEEGASLLDSLIELGQDALARAEAALPELSERADEAVAATKAATKKHAPKAAVVLGAIVVAGAVVGGIVLWRMKAAHGSSQSPYSQAVDAAEEAAASADEAVESAEDEAAEPQG